MKVNRVVGRVIFHNFQSILRFFFVQTIWPSQEAGLARQRLVKSGAQTRASTLDSSRIAGGVTAPMYSRGRRRAAAMGFRTPVRLAAVATRNGFRLRAKGPFL